MRARTETCPHDARTRALWLGHMPTGCPRAHARSAPLGMGVARFCTKGPSLARAPPGQGCCTK
eukprot:13458932-Alexandrium_andersonii.AAC.1